MASSGQKRSARPIFAGFGDFVLSHRDEILKSWIAMIDQHPNISASDNLTYTQLLDHLPELCAELAVLVKQPNAKEIKREAKRDAQAHGWKRWRQGYKLDELIREICLVRRDFIDTWLPAFSATNARFNIDAQNCTRPVVEAFFDNVIIEATVQFVGEHDQAVRQMNTGLRTAKEWRAARKAEFIKLVTHRLREPLGPLLFALDVLQQEEWLSPRGVEMIRPASARCRRRSESHRRNAKPCRNLCHRFRFYGVRDNFHCIRALLLRFPLSLGRGSDFRFNGQSRVRDSVRRR